MARELSPVFTAAINDETTDEVPLVLLTIDHPDLAEPIRVVSDIENITSQGELYAGLPFEIEFPGESADSPGEARLAVDNVDRTIIDTLREIDTAPTITIAVVLASQPNTIEFSFDNMTLRDASYDVHRITGVLRFEDVADDPICESQTPERFPGLH